MANKINEVSFPVIPGWINLNTSAKITVEFEDHGQDFLEWDIVNGKVVAVRPFQEWVWKDAKVLNLTTGPGDYLTIIPANSKRRKLLIKYRIEKVKTHA